jgi:hypothetical protein
MSFDQPFHKWLAALEARHLADLRFPEVARALRALSSTYVERRGRLAQGAALDGAGKRAAFALFYGPLHYLIVEHIARSLLMPGLKTRPTSDTARPTSDKSRPIFDQSLPAPATIVDLGCGTGAAGAACAVTCESLDLIVGVDRHGWALTEAASTYRAFGFRSRTEKADIASTRRLDPRASSKTGRTMFVAAFALNELPDQSRDRVIDALLNRARAGDVVLIVEPLAGFVAPWWPRWRREIEGAGGRSDEWRVRMELPALIAKLDHAAGLDHRELTARSLYISGN